ncbi:hypothetical protein [Streptomyces sp. NPDC003710]
MTPDEELTRYDRAATALMLHAARGDDAAMAELASQFDKSDVIGVTRILAIYACISYFDVWETPENVQWFLRERLHHLALDDTGEAP